MKKRLIIAAILLAAGIAAVMIYRFRNTEEKDVLYLSGNVEVTEVNIAFKIPGRLIELLTDEGLSVTRGDKLAVLDSKEYVSEVAQSRANLRNVEAQLQKARTDFERYEALYNKEAVSRQQLDAARTGYDVAFAQVQQAAASLRTSEARLQDTVIHAPVSGVVLRKIVEPGETVGAGTPIITIGDLEAPWVKVYIKEDKLGRVKLGQKAGVMTDSYPGKIYDGTVTYISSEAEFTPKNVQTREERVKLVFGVKVSVLNENGELKPGMPADVEILLNQ